MTNNPRAVALEALLQVEENLGYSNIVLDKTLKNCELEKRDKALVSQIFYGVLEKRITLDYYIQKFLDNPTNYLDSITRELLRMGIYQSLYLDKIPESAIVNEAVNLAKLKKRDKLSGFINAVLREFLRNKEKVVLPSTESAYGLSINYSVPMELVELWINSYGRENALGMLESLNKKTKTYIRLNSVKNIEFEGLKKYPFLEYAYEYALGGNITESEAFVDGLFHVQDISSQYLCKILNAKPDENIIDVCAAPGGKTFTISEMMNNTGKVYSYDIYKGRVKLIRSGAYRLGLTNVMASMRDATSDTCEIENADRILCDVPCSGFGTIRRKPEIRYKSLEEANNLPKIQLDILTKSSKFIKKDGLLVYSTCTLNPKENGEVATMFLKKNPSFIPVSVKVPDGIERMIDEPDNHLTMMPHACDGDGFFVALFKRR